VGGQRRSINVLASDLYAKLVCALHQPTPAQVKREGKRQNQILPFAFLHNDLPRSSDLHVVVNACKPEHLAQSSSIGLISLAQVPSMTHQAETANVAPQLVVCRTAGGVPVELDLHSPLFMVHAPSLLRRTGGARHWH